MKPKIPSAPLPMKATLISYPQNPLGTLFYVWKQSRSNKPLPFPSEIEFMMNHGLEDRENVYQPTIDVLDGVAERLGYPNDWKGCTKHIRSELEMILNEGIPVVENLNFVFHLENIPISLREQLVRHRIGTSIDGRVGADIIPEPLRQGVLEMRVIPDLAESSWWSQTSRVIPFDTFYDEGRYVVPDSLEGKVVKSPFGPRSQDMSAEEYYKIALVSIQEAYRKLQAAGVHIEDCRNLIPVGATHGITWSLNLKAMLHIFGKRSSWVAQVGLWEKVMMQMAEELVTKVHPMFRMVLQPQCIKKGKYVGCPVSGTNAERIAGVDGMSPCPLWVRYETSKALEAADGTVQGKFPGRTQPAWSPPGSEGNPNNPNEADPADILNWEPERLVEAEMLNRNAELFSKMWGFPVLEGLPKEQP